MISRTAYLAVALLWLPGLATAHNYSYLEGGYLGLDNELEEADGLFLGGSYGLFNHLAVIAEWDTAGDYDQLGAGVQYHRSLTEPLDLTLGATVEQLSVNADDDTGYGLRAGFAGRPGTIGSSSGRRPATSTPSATRRCPVVSLPPTR